MNPPSPNHTETIKTWLAEIADAISLREGIQGVTKALWELHRENAHTTRHWSRTIHIPVPVLAALRRELEKCGLLEQGDQLKLTPGGKEKLQTIFGTSRCSDTLCPTCHGVTQILPPEAYPVLEQFRELSQTRPEVDVTLDQSHATPESAIRKALFLLNRGALADSIFFLGDDDAISLACLLVRQHFLTSTAPFGRLCVADIDTRYLEYLASISEGRIETIQYDVRHDFPLELTDSFKTVLTDPAYTENGVTLFSYRCIQACQKGGTLLLSMPMFSPNILRNIQLNLLQMGWAISGILPRFNEYVGASVHAHGSCLFICERENEVPPEKSISLRYTPLYTGDMRSPGGVYECTACGNRVTVGPKEEWKTIQQLKQEGCFECENHSFKRIQSVADENQ
jgi:N4-bis(aminopropyl)spermidine synthase